jgi:tetratricopeptide (TPR) repeat protein
MLSSQLDNRQTPLFPLSPPLFSRLVSGESIEKRPLYALIRSRKQNYKLKGGKPALAESFLRTRVPLPMQIDAQDAFDINFFQNVLKRDSKNREILELLGSLYSKYDMARQALRIDRRLVRIQPKDSRIHYNLACSLCLLGRKREAIESLSRAIQLGYDDMEWLLQDPDLNELRDHSGFQTLIETQKAHPSSR